MLLSLSSESLLLALASSSSSSLLPLVRSLFVWSRDDGMCRSVCEAAVATGGGGGFITFGFFLRFDLSSRADDDNILNRSSMVMNEGMIL